MSRAWILVFWSWRIALSSDSSSSGGGGGSSSSSSSSGGGDSGSSSSSSSSSAMSKSQLAQIALQRKNIYYTYEPKQNKAFHK